MIFCTWRRLFGRALRHSFPRALPVVSFSILVLYLADGLLGLATGSGYLDLGIINYGIQDLPMGFKILANLPHISLGGIAVLSAFVFRREA